MIDLDNIKSFKNLDSCDVLSSIKMLPLQCQQAWNETAEINFPTEFRKVKNIVIAGMGGSSYGARIVKSHYDCAEMTKTTVELANSYFLPGYVNENTLVILSSYSGNTEETIACAKEAIRKKAKISGLTTGGQLAKLLQEGRYPGYIFNPKYNPCGQPRIGVGYVVTGLIGILAKLKFIPIGGTEIDEMVSFLHANLDDNLAKRLAVKLKDKTPVFIVADFLEGAAYAVRNPFHETAKHFALYFAVPELNHHLLEGLNFPEQIKKLLLFIFVYSDINDDRLKKRMNLTEGIVLRNGFNIEKIKLFGSGALIQSMEFIQLGNWITFYLAMLHNTDPAKIPWVDYFKKELTKGGTL